MINNLLRNAIDHSGDKDATTVVVDTNTRIKIRDDDPDLLEEAHELVFDHCYRLKPRYIGAGLGLNFVHKIVRLHSGRRKILKGE